MPQRKEPKALFTLCAECAAANIDFILKFDAQLAHTLSRQRMSNLQQLPDSLYQFVLDKIFESCAINNGNYRRILSEKTKNLMFKESTSDINQAEFLEFLQDHCKNVVKIDLSPLLSSKRRVAEKYENILVGETLASMPQLEWINLKGCGVDDECLKLIGSKCSMLKYLNVEMCPGVTGWGIRALCDPQMAPFGKCTQLTNLFLHTRSSHKPIYGSGNVANVLLYCPNLEVLDYEKSASALKEAIIAVHDSITEKDPEMNKEKDWFETHIGKYSRRPKNTVLHQNGVFQLKTLEYFADSDMRYLKQFFEAVPKFCPHLENLVLVSTIFSDMRDLHEIFGLPLQSITLAEEGRSNQQYMDHESLLLLRSVGSTLTTLCLRRMCLFDLRVIRNECPSLTTLILKSCSTTKGRATWPDYPRNILSNCVFDSLTELVLVSTSISSENFVDILSSPNLETLELQGYTSRTILLHPIIEKLILDCPGAFDKLLSLTLHLVELDKRTLDMILDNAPLLNELKVLYCYRYPYGENRPFNDEAYIKRRIKDNNWDLTCKCVVDNDLCDVSTEAEEECDDVSGGSSHEESDEDIMNNDEDVMNNDASDDNEKNNDASDEESDDNEKNIDAVHNESDDDDEESEEEGDDESDTCSDDVEKDELSDDESEQSDMWFGETDTD